MRIKTFGIVFLAILILIAAVVITRPQAICEGAYYGDVPARIEYCHDYEVDYLNRYVDCMVVK